jgi:adenine/guanine phosphoribosyltransferase-like PRPP-binding protein
MDKCQCENPGFCEFFKQEMTYDPPNWQWCRDASPQDREKYKISCDKKHARDERFNERFLGSKYIKTSRLIEDCKNFLLPQIGHLNLKGVLGIPRSGMLPASLIAVWLNLPLYTINNSSHHKLETMSACSASGGTRMRDLESSGGKILVVDDTIFAGVAIADMREKISAYSIVNTNEEVLYAVVYAHPDSLEKVDFFGKELKPPHLLEWHFFNSDHVTRALFDLDGVFCPNVPYDKCRNEEQYINYIKNVKPLYHRIPNKPCHGIVTARLDKYRDITEEWLERHGVKYRSLKMYPTEKEKIRDKNHTHEAASFKAKHFMSSSAHIFVESELPEARIIRERSGKLVICPEEGDR